MCYGLKIQKLKRQYGVSNFKKVTVKGLHFRITHSVLPGKVTLNPDLTAQP